MYYSATRTLFDIARKASGLIQLRVATTHESVKSCNNSAMYYIVGFCCVHRHWSHQTSV